MAANGAEMVGRERNLTGRQAPLARHRCPFEVNSNTETGGPTLSGVALICNSTRVRAVLAGSARNDGISRVSGTPAFWAGGPDVLLSSVTA